MTYFGSLFLLSEKTTWENQDLCALINLKCGLTADGVSL